MAVKSQSTKSSILTGKVWRYFLVPSLLANLPFVVLLCSHFPHYNTGLRLLITHEPGQYLFLLFCFPVTALLVARSEPLIKPLFDLPADQYVKGDYVDRLCRSFVRPERMPKASWDALGIGVGVLIASLDSMGTSGDYGSLKANQARTAAFASAVVVDAATQGDTVSLVNAVHAELADPSALLNWTGLTSEGFVERFDENVLRDAKTGHEYIVAMSSWVAENIGEALPNQSGAARRAVEQVTAKDVASADKLLHAIVYVQTLSHPNIRTHFLARSYWLQQILNFAELVAVVFVCTHLFRWAFAASCLRLVVSAPEPLAHVRQAGYHTFFAALFMAVWPPLRMLTDAELRLVTPTSRSWDAPLVVLSYVAAIAVLSIIACTGKKQHVRLTFLAIASVAHLALFSASVVNAFNLRAFIFGGTGAASLVLWMLAYGCWITIVFVFLWLSKLSDPVE